MKDLKKIINKIKPDVERLILNTARGYLFGCVFGAFTPSKQPLLRAMNENGRNFAKMSALYTLTEISLEKVRRKNDLLNSVAGGVVAGSAGSFHGGVSGAVILGGYSGITRYFSK